MALEVRTTLRVLVPHQRLLDVLEHRYHQRPPGLELGTHAITINPQLMHLRNRAKGESQCHT